MEAHITKDTRIPLYLVIAIITWIIGILWFEFNQTSEIKSIWKTMININDWQVKQDWRIDWVEDKQHAHELRIQKLELTK